jgi:predicted amidophosphoribosyltransferase
MRGLVELLAPLRCVACGAEGGDELCPACAPRVRVLTRPWCERCGTPQGNTRSIGHAPCRLCSHLGGFDRARSLVVFVEPARRLTLQLKRRGRLALAAAIGELLAAMATREGLARPQTCVTWVPGGKKTRAVGFDHAGQIATTMARSLGARSDALLRRAHDGPRQADVPLARRRENVAGRFAAQSASGHVLLVDDVFTTGSTAEACATALREAGAERVDVITWARTLRLRP